MTAKEVKMQPSFNIQDIMKSMPQHAGGNVPVHDQLGDLIAMIATKKVPVNAMTRLCILGNAHARIALGYLAYFIRNSFVNETEKQRLLNEAHLKSALKLFGTMGYLRGAMIKVGQILGNMPHVVPDEFSKVLGSFHFQAPPMHFSMIREVFFDEMGKEPDEVFEYFDRTAFAAASLGQVHRARLKSGEEVAVKIQYPNMTRTIRSDLRSLRAILQPLRFSSELSYVLEHLKDAERMLMIETDYTKEAEFIEKARALFTKEDLIIVPRVWDDYSSQRVLTMDYLPGCHLEEFLSSNPDQETRDHFGRLISTAFIRIWCREKIIYDDQNPGNFLFMDNGRLGFIDFGSQRKQSDKEWELIFELIYKAHAGLLENNLDSIDEVIADACFFDQTKNVGPDKLELLRKQGLWWVEAMMEDKPFDFSDAESFTRGLALQFKWLKKGYLKFKSQNNSWVRAILGQRTLLYRIRSRFNCHAIYRKEISAVAGKGGLGTM